MDRRPLEDADAGELLHQGRDVCRQMSTHLLAVYLLLGDLFAIYAFLSLKFVVACSPLILGVVATSFYYYQQNNPSGHFVDYLVSTLSPLTDNYIRAFISFIPIGAFVGWLISRYVTAIAAILVYTVRASVDCGLIPFDSQEEWDQFLEQRKHALIRAFSRMLDEWKQFRTQCWQAFVRANCGFFPQQSGMWDLKKPVDGHNFEDEARQTLISKLAIDSGENDALDGTSSAGRKSSIASETC